MNILKRLFTNERGTFKVVARGNGVTSTAIKYVLKSDDGWEAVD